MRVMIVEDEPDLLTSLAKALREEGYAVDLAHDGREGLMLALDGVHDLIVLDTPPTAHALDFLDAPNRVLDFFGDERVRKVLADPTCHRVVRVSAEDEVGPLPFRLPALGISESHAI